MNIVIVSDIHANLAALEAVLASAPDAPVIWCLGDTVGYGPCPNECLDVLRARAAICIAGNHDWAALDRLPLDSFNTDARLAAEWTSRMLTPGNVEFLENLPLTAQLGDFTLVHGTLRNPVWEYLTSTRLAGDVFGLLQTPFCLVGHTHVPAVYLEPAPGRPARMFAPPHDRPLILGAERLILNPGSVGQPRDGLPEASFALLDTDAKEIQYRRVPYDIEKTQRLMQAAHLPARLWQRLAYGW